ncbi:MAG: PBECR2 nuclease fold domain-containing protein [Cycloclasticus sp.]
MPAKYGSLAFQEAIDFFRDKVRVPTAAWTDIWEGQHARAFTIAGAMKDDILLDFQTALDKSIADGGSLRDFRKDFDSIVDKHGWGYNGGRDWRTRVIYETNLYQAHNSGRYTQMQKVKRSRPYWRYRHNDAVEHPRPEHLAWDGLILSAEDPFWDTHFPANGWGCKCFVQSLNERDINKLGKTIPDKAPAIKYEEKTVGIRGPSPRKVKVPQGIDPGFAYNPGKAAFGEALSDDVMAEWKKTKNAWQPLNTAGWAEAGRPKQIPLNATPVKLAARLKTKAEVLELLQKQQGDQKLYSPGGIPVTVRSKQLASHIDPNRSEYLPLIDDLLTNPYEVWLSFEKHKGTGKINLRARFIKGYEFKKGKFVLLVANARKGQLEGFTFIPTSDNKYIQNQRLGELVYGDE